MTISSSTLETFEGKAISEICGIGYTASDLNHCAHFVSHALNITIGVTCRMMKSGAPKEVSAATIRVHELFSKCPKVGLWDDEPDTLEACLIFVTKASGVDVKAKTMANIPKKHVGIAIGKQVWHYSNSKDKVVKVPVETFRKHYFGDGYELYYGDIPK